MRVFNIIICVLIFSKFEVRSQGYDNLWLTGYQCCQPNFGGTDIDFLSGQIQISSTVRDMPFGGTNAVITDSLGNLLFYTNGWYIANSENDTMVNGSGLCSDPFTYLYRNIGLPITQGALIIPFGNGSTFYYLFHVELNSADVAYRPLKLSYSIIDMSQDSGRGAVVSKNNVLFQDTLPHGHLTACRHANGRDWWVVMPKSTSSTYYIILATPYGLTYHTQTIGLMTKNTEGVGQSTFSPDGSKYAKFDPGNGLIYFEFDRCTGTFFNYQHIDSSSFHPQQGCAGVSFSANSRYLYLSYQTKLYQIDTYAPNLITSLQFIANYDGFSSPFPTTFYTCKLAPDNKIYLTSNNGTNKLHLINYPDSAGINCDVQQHAIDLPTYNASSISTQPFFSLRNQQGSICDSLFNTGISDLSSEDFLVYPNPTTGASRLKTSNHGEHTVIVTDCRGVIFQELKVDGSSGSIDLDLKYLNPGVYYIDVRNNKMNQIKKIVKL